MSEIFAVGSRYFSFNAESFFLLKMKISEVINMLMKSVDSEIEIVVDNEFKKFTFDLFVHGFHVYQTAWSPIIGEEDLECR